MAAKEVQFRNRVSVPVPVDDAAKDERQLFDAKKAAALALNNEGGRGGWYPIGANQVWHNGIHLAAPPGTFVRSVANGRIVAARLGHDFTKEELQFGSPRFVLIRHQISLLDNPTEKDHNNWITRDVEFYSLSMHLDTGSRSLQGIPWLESFLPFLERNNCSALEIMKVNVAEDAEPGSTAKIGLNCRKEPTEKKPGQFKPGDLVRCLRRGTIVEALRGRKGEWQEIRVPSLSIDSAWVYAAGNRLLAVPDFTAQVDALAAGQCAKLDYPVESGEPIGHVGIIHPARYMKLQFNDVHGVHLEIFSAKNEIAAADKKGWTILEDDSDDDAICETAAIVAAKDNTSPLRKLAWNSSRYLNFEQAKHFYSSLSAEERVALRQVVTRNTSYWAIDWKKVRDVNPDWAKQFDFDDEDQAVAERYVWWSECEGKQVALPARTGGKALAYHYHPLGFLGYVADHLVPLPVFYVKRGDKELVVARPGDIQIASKEKVYVFEPPEVDWLLGRGQTLQGCEGIGNVGEIDLYEALTKPATTPGIPAIDADKKRIWSAIWWSEGCIEALNTYDSAFLSFGPIQQTVGTGTSKGELQGALAAVNTASAEVFKKYFGRFGVEVIEVAKELKVDKGHLRVDGTDLKDAASKQRLRDFIWAYRCVKAMSDVAFRRPFLEHGFKRIDVIRSLTATVGGADVKLTDVFKTEAAQALILDAHINLPAKVDSNDGIWVKAAKKALGITGTATIDTTAITRDDEYDMIAELLKQRNSSGMWSPEQRAAHILLCAEDLDDALAKKFGYADLAALKTATGLTAKQAEARMYDFLKHAR